MLLGSEAASDLENLQTNPLKSIWLLRAHNRNNSGKLGQIMPVLIIHSPIYCHPLVDESRIWPSVQNGSQKSVLAFADLPGHSLHSPAGAAPRYTSDMD